MPPPDPHPHRRLRVVGPPDRPAKNPRPADWPLTELGLDPALLGKLNTPDRRNPADLPDLGLAYVGQLADVTRAALTAAGVTPQELNSLRRAARRVGGVTPADWYDPTAAAPRSRADCFDCHHHQLAAD